MSQKLHATKNYRLFELCTFNRDVTKVSKLKKSLRQHGYIPAYPMHVIRNGAGKLKIKAGHHRFVAAMELGLPVFYVICDDNATIHELERATTPWKMRDYLASFCRCGMPDYLELRTYIEATGIGIQAAVSMHGGQCAGSGNFGAAFKGGTYKIVDREHPRKVAEIVSHCTSAGVECARHPLFVTAVSQMLRLETFDARQFMGRVTVNAEMAKRQPSLDAYRQLIEAIYNRKSQHKVPLAFLCAQAARERAVGRSREG